MAYFNQSFYKDSYFLEFINGGDTQGIAFSLPPQSEEYSFPQRIGETKTFGGTIFEDYGNDAGKISLSGTTANSEIRIVYTSRGPKFVTGENEIFEIKDMIKNYGQKSRIGKKCYLFCLTPGNKNKYWPVVINDFVIKRSKDKPLAYDYTLSCTIAESDLRASKLSWLDNFVTAIQNICETMHKITSFMQKVLFYYSAGLDLIYEINNAVDSFESELNNYANILSETMEITGNYFTETQALGDNIIASAKRVTVGNTLNLNQKAYELKEKTKEFINYINSIDVENIPNDLKETYNLTAEEIKAVWTEEAKELDNESNSIVAQTNLQTATLDYSVIPGDKGEDDVVVPVYGYSLVTIKDSDTWDSLAAQHYGNASYGLVIALYNNLPTGEELQAGTVIKLPILNKKDAAQNLNKVYGNSANEFDVENINENTTGTSSNGTRANKGDRNYGIDIKLSNNGDLSANQGDLAVIYGDTNLDQAIRMRLETALNSRIRNSVYGIKASIGSVTQTESYLISSIEQTLMEEPRIKSIEKLSYSGDGDNLLIYIEYTDINNQRQNFGGKI